MSLGLVLLLFLTAAAPPPPAPAPRIRLHPSLRCETTVEGKPMTVPSPRKPQLSGPVTCELNAGPATADKGLQGMIQTVVDGHPYRTRLGRIAAKKDSVAGVFVATLTPGVFGKGDYETCKPARLIAEITGPSGKVLWRIERKIEQRCRLAE